MKPIIRHLIGTVLMLCLFPALTGCNDEDDVMAIFTDKTWKMTFIALEGQTQQFDFWDGDSSARKKSMEKLGKEGNFTLNFDGSPGGSIGQGEFTGQGISSSVSGTWSADGSSNSLSISLSKNPSESDVLGKAFLNGLKNAFRYEGDVNNLYIYYKEGQTTKFMAFRPQ